MAQLFRIHRGKITVTLAVVMTVAGILVRYLYANVMDEYRNITASTQQFSVDIDRLNDKVSNLPKATEAINARLYTIEQKIDRNNEESQKRMDRILEIIIKMDK